jgi:uncharacterized protein YodC (DUF2158 family)
MIFFLEVVKKMKVNDIVKLKSGGPLMTIQRIIGESKALFDTMDDDGWRIKGFCNGDALCCWFVGKKLKTEAFSIKSLEEVNSENKIN